MEEQSWLHSPLLVGESEAQNFRWPGGCDWRFGFVFVVKTAFAGWLSTWTICVLAANIEAIAHPSEDEKQWLDHLGPHGAATAILLIFPIVIACLCIPYMWKFQGSCLHVASLVGSHQLMTSGILTIPRASYTEEHRQDDIDRIWRLHKFQAIVSWVKLWQLGRKRAAILCFLFWNEWNVNLHTEDQAFWLWLVVTTLFQARALASLAKDAAELAASREEKDPQFAKLLNKQSFFLHLGSVMTVVEAAHMPLTQTWIVPAIGLGWYAGVDLIFNQIMILVIGGVIGPEEDVIALGELSWMMGSRGHRVAFPGRVNLSARDCIVSFPGKYAMEWDDAVRKVEMHEDSCSLACVFLTNKATGLGVHADVAGEPLGRCWCQSLYGKLPPHAYLEVVEDADKMTQEQLDFKLQDAEAMGQVLVIRQGETDSVWKQRKEEALSEATEKCKENQGRAPWGCQWFAKWKANVDKAVECRQTLHVFFFENKVGCGKLAWEDLSHPAALSEAKRDNGLGNSQRAEVAYLDRCHVAYEEHDVREFYAFMSQRMKKKKVPRIGVTSKRTRVVSKAYHTRICSSLRLRRSN
ncbi:unnamed protein product [Symbiodinium sp. CCMP2456]|nr:unnamed protein product [Symbiodinium sp. CCMP2456]